MVETHTHTQKKTKKKKRQQIKPQLVRLQGPNYAYLNNLGKQAVLAEPYGLSYVIQHS